MATRQYIGARYVPKFYQNSVDGSTQWESNVVYEPLMYVTLTNGHMYISKKQVPATVGSPVNNIDYWLDIGSYNGFIEQLQDEIDDINNVSIPAIQSAIALKQDATDNNLATTNKTVVGAINEVNTGLASKQDATDNNLATTDKTVVGAINEVNAKVDDIVSTVSGGNTLTPSEVMIVTDSFYPSLFSGFDLVLNGCVQLGQGGANFGTMAEMITDYTGNKSAIKSIIVIGGTNEHAINTIEERFDALETALAGYVNAKLFIAFIKTNFIQPTERALVNGLITEINNQCATHAFTYLGNFNYTLVPTYAVVSNDAVHPTLRGGARIATAIFNKYANGIDEALIDNYVTVTCKGLTITLILSKKGDINLYINGTTTEALVGGTWFSLGFEDSMCFYSEETDGTALRCLKIKLDNGGSLNFGMHDNVLSAWYNPESSGVQNLPSSTEINSQMIVCTPFGDKSYRVTNS